MGILNNIRARIRNVKANTYDRAIGIGTSAIKTVHTHTVDTTQKMVEETAEQVNTTIDNTKRVITLVKGETTEIIDTTRETVREGKNAVTKIIKDAPETIELYKEAVQDVAEDFNRDVLQPAGETLAKEWGHIKDGAGFLHEVFTQEKSKAIIAEYQTRLTEISNIRMPAGDNPADLDKFKAEFARAKAAEKEYKISERVPGGTLTISSQSADELIARAQSTDPKEREAAKKDLEAMKYSLEVEAKAQTEAKLKPFMDQCQNVIKESEDKFITVLELGSNGGYLQDKAQAAEDAKVKRLEAIDSLTIPGGTGNNRMEWRQAATFKEEFTKAQQYFDRNSDGTDTGRVKGLKMNVRTAEELIELNKTDPEAAKRELDKMKVLLKQEAREVQSKVHTKSSEQVNQVATDVEDAYKTMKKVEAVPVVGDVFKAGDRIGSSVAVAAGQVDPEYAEKLGERVDAGKAVLDLKAASEATDEKTKDEALNRAQKNGVSGTIQIVGPLVNAVTKGVVGADAVRNEKGELIVDGNVGYKGVGVNGSTNADLVVKAVQESKDTKEAASKIFDQSKVGVGIDKENLELGVFVDGTKKTTGVVAKIDKKVEVDASIDEKGKVEVSTQVGSKDYKGGTVIAVNQDGTKEVGVITTVKNVTTKVKTDGENVSADASVKIKPGTSKDKNKDPKETTVVTNDASNKTKPTDTGKPAAPLALQTGVKFSLKKNEVTTAQTGIKNGPTTVKLQIDEDSADINVEKKPLGKEPTKKTVKTVATGPATPNPVETAPPATPNPPTMLADTAPDKPQPGKEAPDALKVLGSFLNIPNLSTLVQEAVSAMQSTGVKDIMQTSMQDVNNAESGKLVVKQTKVDIAPSTNKTVLS